MAGWSDLQHELLSLIANFLVTYTDQVRFACVCTSWRSILPTISGKGIQPWLLIPRNSTNKKYEIFYSLHGRKVHYLEVPEEVLSKKFRGSSHGWLVSIEDSPAISLFNPITRVQITLPPRYKFPDVRKYCAKKLDSEYALEPYERRKTETYFLDASHVHEHLLDKVVLSSSPTTSNSKDNFMIAAIYGSHRNLAYCKLGDKKWTPIYKGWTGYYDAIFYEDKLYALTFRRELEVYEFSTAYPKKIVTVEPPTKEGFPQSTYLVNTSIGLLQVQRHLRKLGPESYCYQTSYFNLYKYESSNRSWCKVENIGENVLFLGLNTSISIASSSLPPGEYYKGNHIYFTDDNLDQHEVGVGGGHDIGIYDLDSRLAKRMVHNDKFCKWMWPTPIWYMYNPEDFINE